MSKQSILKRFTNLIRAKINNWFDLAEDPVDNLKRQIAEYSAFIDQHENAVIDVTIDHDSSKLAYNEAVEEFNKLEHTVEKARALLQEAEAAGDTERVEYLKDRTQLAYREYQSTKKNLEQKQETLKYEEKEVQRIQAEHTQLKEELAALNAQKDDLISKLRLAQSRDALESVKKELSSSDGILKEIQNQTHRLQQGHIVRKELEESTDAHKLASFQEELVGSDVDSDFEDFLKGGSLSGSGIKELE